MSVCILGHTSFFFLKIVTKMSPATIRIPMMAAMYMKSFSILKPRFVDAFVYEDEVFPLISPPDPRPRYPGLPTVRDCIPFRAERLERVPENMLCRPCQPAQREFASLAEESNTHTHKGKKKRRNHTGIGSLRERSGIPCIVDCVC